MAQRRRGGMVWGPEGWFGDWKCGLGSLAGAWPLSVTQPVVQVTAKLPHSTDEKNLVSTQNQKWYGHGSAKPSLTWAKYEVWHCFPPLPHAHFDFRVSKLCFLVLFRCSQSVSPCFCPPLVKHWEWVLPTSPWYFEDKYAMHFGELWSLRSF